MSAAVLLRCSCRLSWLAVRVWSLADATAYAIEGPVGERLCMRLTNLGTALRDLAWVCEWWGLTVLVEAHS